jgi:transcription initiation factor IIE alpha subunit
MHHIEIDDYVVDVLMPDLAGHDRSPHAFLVYLTLWTLLFRNEEKRVAISLQELAERTGISKSSVQGSIRLLKRRQLISVVKPTPTSIPQYELIRHWVRRRARSRS